MTNEYYVAMTIGGNAVPSSAVAHGTKARCEESARRLNRRAHVSVRWVVFPCVTNEIQKQLFS
jgi:hypothetical protein